MRGGSSKGVFFHRRDLPEDRALSDPIFLAAIGSPDAYGRQLDGMGGGYSSVSKIVVMAPSARTDADVDYTFGQVAVGRPEVHYRTTCGNLMAAAAHFALDEGLVVARDGGATVRIFDTNTRKNVVARFATEGGLAAVEGDFAVVVRLRQWCAGPARLPRPGRRRHRTPAAELRTLRCVRRARARTGRRLAGRRRESLARSCAPSSSASRAANRLPT